MSLSARLSVLHYQKIYNHSQKFKSMTFNFLPHPPNSAWLPPLDPNDEETLEQEQMMIEQQFKNILSQDLTGAFGPLELREEEEQQQQEQQQGDEMDEYTDQIQIPEGEEQI